MAKLLATDLDGTLMYPYRYFHLVPRKNILFLRKWIDKGNRLVLISSRGPEFMERLRKEIKRDFDYISYTSSYICCNGKIIKDESIPGKDVMSILEEISHDLNPKAYLVNQKNEPLLIKNVSGVGLGFLFIYKLYWLIQGKKREKYLLNNEYFDEHVSKGNIYKIMVFFGLRKSRNKISKEANKILRDKFPNIECSWSHIVNEITPKNCNKGAGLEYYCKYLNILPEDVYVVGDSGNDISMFNLFHENSYAMAKAYPSVKKYAKHTISRVYHLDKIVFGKED